MPIWATRRQRSRRRSAAVLAVVCLALLGPSGMARGSDEGASPLGGRIRQWMERRLENFCLTPAVDGAFQQVMKTGALQGALGNAFTLAGASAHDDRIDLTIHDASAQSYSVVLALQSIASRRADGREGPFLFYLDPTTNGHAEVTAALLGAASVLARAIPDSALSPCGQRTEGDARAARYLVTASVEVQIIVLAVVIGLRALRQPIDPH